MTEAAKPTSRVVRCPRCRKSVRFDATNAFRPFCSALCKNEDIVAWAEQGYRIPIEDTAEGDGDDVKPPDDDEG